MFGKKRKIKLRKLKFLSRNSNSKKRSDIYGIITVI